MTIMRHRLCSLLTVAVVIAAATGCGDAESSDDPDDTIPTSTTVPDGSLPVDSMPDDTVPDNSAPENTVPAPAGPEIEGWPVAPELIEAAVVDLMSTVGVARDEIVILRAEQVTWRSGALGCPVPDRSYTQALVDGYRIELSVDGSIYWYHGAGDGDPFFCLEPVEPAPGGSADR